MKKALWVLAVAVAGLGAYAANVLATPSVGQSTTTLGKALAAEPVDLSGHAKQPGGGWRARLHTHGISDFYVIDNKFEVGGTSGWHSHPGPHVERKARSASASRHAARRSRPRTRSQA